MWNICRTPCPIAASDEISATEYRSSFVHHPKQSKNPIIDKPPGNPIQYESTVTAKKSATISNFAEVIGKPDVMFSKADAVWVPSDKPKPNESEYNAKFKPFSTYFYTPGDGFRKTKDGECVAKANQWYSEVEELNRQAKQYKTRSQLGHPVSSEGLEHIYSQGSPWNNYHKDRDLQALSLATTQKIIEEKRQERNVRALVTPPKSTHARLLSSAPPSLRSEAPHMSSKAAVSTKSPNAPPRPKSADKPTPRAKADTNEKQTPKIEGKVWLKSKKLAQETPHKETKKEVNAKPNANGAKKTNNNGQNGSKSPRPTSLTASFNNNNNNNNNNNKSEKPIPVLPPGPVKTTQIRSPEEITGIKSPSPESWTVPIEGGLNWMNGETPNKFDSKFDTIKQTPITTVEAQPSFQSSKFKVIKPETNKNKSNKSITTAATATPSSMPSQASPSLSSSHSKPTAKVMPSSSSSISSSVDEEVKIIKPISARQKASNVLDKARHRLDHFWSRNK